MKILVVDDEQLLVKGIKFNLENEGYQVITAYNGAEAVAYAKSESPDLILMDLMMPEVDGLEACMQIREFSSVPLIMLTAKGEDMDKVLGFEYGADDYITKPFNILELKARIRALLRRSSIVSAQSPAVSQITAGNITLDLSRHIAEKDGVEIELTGKEFDLFELFIRNPGKVYTREDLLSEVWRTDYRGDIRTVDVHVHRLRDKLEDDPTDPQRIMTKWGVGYYFKA